MAPLLVNFHGAASGDWHVTSQNCLVGPTLPLAPCMVIGAHDGWQSPRWSLAGVVSNLRYTTAAERADLTASHSGLGRTEAVCGALIPIRKSPAWWALAQDERRAIYARSQHTPIGLDYLPAIARRLHHSRDLGQPFDFLTWFEYAPDHESDFNALLAKLRATEEWQYVDREIDIRVTRGKNIH